jgi:hypothetical protein
MGSFTAFIAALGAQASEGTGTGFSDCAPRLGERLKSTLSGSSSRPIERQSFSVAREKTERVLA